RAAALPVDGDGRHAVGKLRGEDSVAPKGKGLLSRLCHAAHDHVVDGCRIDPGTVDEGIQHFTAQVRGVPSSKLAVPATAGRSGRINNIGFGHRVRLLQNRVCVWLRPGDIYLTAGDS